MLALVLLPTVSHALAFAQGGKTAWAEVCTPQGMKLVALDDAPGAGDMTPPQGDIHLEHCPYCTLSGQSNAMPPAPPAAPALLAGADALPLLFLQAPRTLFAWRSAQPRGPPLIS